MGLKDLKEVKRLVDNHDFYYMYSDEGRVYKAGLDHYTLTSVSIESLPDKLKSKAKRYLSRKTPKY